MSIGDEDRPGHRVDALADDRPRCHIDEYRSKQRECDSDAPENEVFPRSFQSLWRSINSDHEDRGKGCKLHGHPHQADAVCNKCEVHAKHHNLIHGMIKTQIACSESAYFQLVGDIAGTEHACGEGNEGIENNKYDVQVVDLQIG